MKYIRKFLCAAMAGICMTVIAGAAEGVGDLSPQGAKAYLNLLNAAEKQYGKAHIATSGSNDRLWAGLSLAKLVDFDGDGIPELYYAARPAGGRWIQRLYTLQNGKVLQLKIPESVSNFGTDVSPSTLLYIGADKAYLVDGQEVMNGNPVNYFTKKGTEIVSDFVYTEPEWGDSRWTANGKTVSQAEAESQKKALTQGMTEENYSFWAFDSQNNESLNTSITETKNALQNRIYTPASPSMDKLTIDGKLVQTPVYKINGNNYYMLRRLAYSLSGTDAQFDVGWDAQKRQITLTKDKPYTPVGGETDSFELTTPGAEHTEASIYLNGKPLTPTVYNINGNNFFKLRDLAQALDFSVEWDEKDRTVQINTKRSSNNQSDAEAEPKGENFILTAHTEPMRVLNTFLSSFSEASFSYDTAFTSGDMEKMIDFAFIHNIIHNQEALQYSDSYMSFSADIIAQTVKEYFNVDITRQSTSQFTYRDNRYYSPAAAGESYSYCSIADEMYYNEKDDTHDVHFVVFSTPDMNITELMNTAGIFFLSDAESKSYLQRLYEGTATIGRNNKGEYYLISYQVSKT